MQELINESSKDVMGILLVNFANAYYTVDRNLMISLTSESCPELVELTWWLYKLQPMFVTNNGQMILSPTGAQKGCRVSNPLFALTMQHIT